MEEEPETKEPFYECSKEQCSSPIEIIFLDKENIEFRCFNKKSSHIIKMKIGEFIDVMKRHSNSDNKGICLFKNHYKKNKSYCLECNKHLCKICLESREHISHHKIDIKEVLPTKEEIELIDNIIKDIQDKKEYNNLKDLYEIIYNTYTKYNNNYYYCINLNYILINYIDNNKSFKDKLSKEKYENIIKIKEKNNKNNEDIINKIKEENKQMKIKYEKEIINLKENYENELSKLKNENIKLSKELKNNKEFEKNNIKINHESTSKEPEIESNNQEQKIQNNLEKNIKGFNYIKNDINKSKDPSLIKENPNQIKNISNIDHNMINNNDNFLI